MLKTGIFSYCENLSIFVSNYPFKFHRRSANILRVFFNGMSKGQVDVMQNRASSSDQVARVTRYNKYFFHKMLPNRQVSPQKTHHSKSIFYAKSMFWR